MYDLHIKCPRCMHRMIVGEEDAGHLRTCPKCGCRFEIPGQSKTRTAPIAAVATADTSVVSASEKLRKKMEEQAHQRTSITIMVLGWLGLITCIMVVLTTPVTITQMATGFVACLVVGIILLCRKNFINGVLIACVSVLFYLIFWGTYDPPKKVAKSNKKLFVPGEIPKYEPQISKKTDVSSQPTPTAQPVPTPSPVPVVSEPALEEEVTVDEPDTSYRADYSDDQDEFTVVQQGEPQGDSDVIVAEMPFVLYDDCEGQLPFSPYGWMGNQEAIYQDDCWAEHPQSGKTCIKIVYDDIGRWGGAAWQAPPNNWGDNPAVYDLSKADRLTFWAKGHHGNEMVEFKVGLLSKGTSSFHDTARRGLPKTALHTVWTKYEIDLSDKDLSGMITGFVWVLSGAKSPVTFYIDNVKFESDPNITKQ